MKEFRDYLGVTALKMDLNGMPDLDFATHPKGVIRESQELTAAAFRAKTAFFLVNGTTSGVQTMMISACHPGDEIIIPRNAHKSAVNGLILSGAMPIYIQPEINRDFGLVTGVTTENIVKAIANHPHAKAVFAINPSYYGISPDLKSIVKIAHQNKMSVIVDEAHGAHLSFCEGLPISGMDAGADLCSVSMHKTGGSLTQSAVLLVGNGQISTESVQEALGLSFTTSASYLLLSSLELARKQLAIDGPQLIEKILRMTRWARQEINKIDGIYAFGKEVTGFPGAFDFDELKLTISLLGLGLTGYCAENILRENYNIQIELSDLYNILPYIGVGDTEEDLAILIAALKDLAATYTAKEKRNCQSPIISPIPEMIVTPRDAFYSPKKIIAINNATDEIAGETIMAYPPGIPVVSLGERISEDLLEYIRLLKSQGCALQGTTDPGVEYIRVLGTGEN